MHSSFDVRPSQTLDGREITTILINGKILRKELGIDKEGWDNGMIKNTMMIIAGKS